MEPRATSSIGEECVLTSVAESPKRFQYNDAGCDIKRKKKKQHLISHIHKTRISLRCHMDICLNMIAIGCQQILNNMAMQIVADLLHAMQLNVFEY